MYRFSPIDRLTMADNKQSLSYLRMLDEVHGSVCIPLVVVAVLPDVPQIQTVPWVR